MMAVATVVNKEARTVPMIKPTLLKAKLSPTSRKSRSSPTSRRRNRVGGSKVIVRFRFRHAFTADVFRNSFEGLALFQFAMNPTQIHELQSLLVE